MQDECNHLWQVTVIGCRLFKEKAAKNKLMIQRQFFLNWYYWVDLIWFQTIRKKCLKFFCPKRRSPQGLVFSHGDKISEFDQTFVSLQETPEQAVYLQSEIDAESGAGPIPVSG